MLCTLIGFGHMSIQHSPVFCPISEEFVPVLFDNLFLPFEQVYPVLRLLLLLNYNIDFVKTNFFIFKVTSNLKKYIQ
jgi:hypothetical protein